MLTSIAVIVVLLIAGILIVAATKPDIFRVRRSASINAPPIRETVAATLARRYNSV